MTSSSYFYRSIFCTGYYKGRTITFFDGWRGGGGGGGRGWEIFRNKLFAEAVNTERNCMQVKKKVFTGNRGAEKNCLQQEPNV